MDVPELTPEITHQIERLRKEGEHAMHRQQPDLALVHYHQAWALLPEPAEQWPAALFVLTAIAEAHFQLKNYNTACTCFSQARTLPKGEGNPYVHLRLGQCLFEQNRHQSALEQLALAYLGDHGKVFRGEDEKYLAFVRTVWMLP